MPGPYKGFPRGGSCRPQATDEGGVRGSLPFTGTGLGRGLGHLPPKGKAFKCYPKNVGNCASSFSIARPRWLMASFSSGVSWA